MTETGLNRDTSSDSSIPSNPREKQPTPLEIFDFPFKEDTPHAQGKARGLAYVREKWKNADRVKMEGVWFSDFKKNFLDPLPLLYKCRKRAIILLFSSFSSSSSLTSSSLTHYLPPEWQFRNSQTLYTFTSARYRRNAGLHFLCISCSMFYSFIASTRAV